MEPKEHIHICRIVASIILLIFAGASLAMASSDSDKALSTFWKGRYATNQANATHHYETAIALCPGFIRPYELPGNIHRKNGRVDKALEYFNQAAELGTTNYKLYYLLAELLFESGDLDSASRHIRKALSIKADDPKALKLNREIERAGDKEATGRRILTELFDRLPKMVGPNDRVLFYFAGHGQTEELPGGGKRGYIIPVDADRNNSAKAAVSMEQSRSLSSRIRAKHILYVMACYSGLGLNRSTGVSQSVNEYLRKVSSLRVVQIVTAGGQGEQVQERQGHGLFTSYFVKAIEGEADINKVNVVTGTELGANLRPTVSNASRQAQTPLFGRLEGEGEFLFFVQPGK